ncbi:MAG: selenocysteine-specific translation elongation factor [Chloroflexota bacterium]
MNVDPPSVVFGTAGHIDHGKTTLLRALTGIDADRLPEERRRGMTIDVGYAHLMLSDGRVLDFVDVPGHDRLVGNMLVGAGEIDAALVVVAADDGPRAQTFEHLELLDALGIRDGVAAVTKVDAVSPQRVSDVHAEVTALLRRTTLTSAPVISVSSVDGAGLDELRTRLSEVAERVAPRLASGAGGRLAIDRVFAVRGRGAVVTGSLRGGMVRTGDVLRLVPGDRDVRIREVQVRGVTVDASTGGRTGFNLASIAAADLHRGLVLTADPSVVASSRLLVALRPAVTLGSSVVSEPAADESVRVHIGTESVDAIVVRGPREAIELGDGQTLAILRLDRPIAVAPGDRFVVRRPSPAATLAGGIVLDTAPPRGVSRRRLTETRAERLRAAIAREPREPALVDAALVETHGAVVRPSGSVALAPDVRQTAEEHAIELVAARARTDPDSPAVPLATVRTAVAQRLRRLVTLPQVAADAAARDVVDAVVHDGRVVRDGDQVRDPSVESVVAPATATAIERLLGLLRTPTPPGLESAARAAGCPPDAIRRLETERRIVRLEDDLAWEASTYRDLARTALEMAASAPLTPAAYRDATGSSRRYVMVILEDLDRRGLLTRTDAGHVLGPKARARVGQRATSEQPAERMPS